MPLDISWQVMSLTVLPIRVLTVHFPLLGESGTLPSLRISDSGAVMSHIQLRLFILPVVVHGGGGMRGVSRITPRIAPAEVSVGKVYP